MFAKSQLIGFDNMSTNLSKNELDEFKRSLFNKINATFNDQDNAR